MDIHEIKDMAQSLKRRLELLASAGLTGIPKFRAAGQEKAGISSEWATFSGPLAGAALSCGEGQKGVLFGVWPLGGVAAIWGVPVTGGSIADSPFGREPLSQLEKMLSWLAGEIKAGKPDIANPHVVLASKGPEAGSYSDTDAAEVSAKELLERTQNVKGVLLMGELAALAVLQTADLGNGRGRVHRMEGRAMVCTFSPDEVLRDQEAKKGAHADLKLLIRALGTEGL